MINLITEISDVEFDNCTFESNMPAMVMFSAARCSVCTQLLPVVEEIAAKYTGSLNVYKINVDIYKPMAARFRLKGIPQLLIFKDGEIKERIGGLRSEEELAEMIDKLV